MTGPELSVKAALTAAEIAATIAPLGVGDGVAVAFADRLALAGPARVAFLAAAGCEHTDI